MISYEELRRLNAEILAEAARDLGLDDGGRERLDRIRRICETHISKNEALKRRLTRDRDYQLRCQNIDARSAPLREILGIVREGGA